MSVTLSEFAGWLDAVIPPEYQESYDNSGLQVGDPGAHISSVLLTLDVTPDVIAEAAECHCDLILSHHPLIFSPLKRLSSGSMTERCVAEAVRKNIAVYSAHTSFDAMSWGVSSIMAEKAGLTDVRVLVPSRGKLYKLAVFVPLSHADDVRQSLFSAGAGHTGRYSSCSFTAAGDGTFKAGEGASPWVGRINELHTEREVKIETIVPSHLVRLTVETMKKAHPYEEPAYDIYPLENVYEGAGSGAIGTLPEPVMADEYLAMLKEVFGIPVIRFSGSRSNALRTVAVCGGAGAGLINAAVRAGADAFITADIKYHSFTEAPADILLADIGHYESEKFSLTLLYDLIIKKFPNFALRFSEIKTNPINYF